MAYRRLSDAPLVSIVTPSFNQGRYIRETVESVLGQAYPDIEYMVMDGGSTDETVDVLKSFGDRFVWVSEPDKGQPDAINKGWKRARGEVLAWLNSDDIYLPGAVGRAVAYLKAHPDAGLVYGEGYHIREDGSVIERYPTEPFDRERLKETCYICQPTVFIRREVIEDVGMLDPSLQLALDYDLWLRAAKRHAFGRVPEYLACTRLYPGAKTLRQRVEAHRQILDVVKRNCGRVPPSWIYAYAHARLDGRFDRSKITGDMLFALALIGLSAKKFIELNHGVPASEVGRWWGWLKNGLRRRGRGGR